MPRTAGAAVLVALLAASSGCGGTSPRAAVDQSAATSAAPSGAVAMRLDAVPYAVVDARTLSVSVPVGGGCDQRGTASVQVEETAERVTLRASVRPGPSASQTRDGPCPAVLLTAPVTVVLAAPLGARTVVDGVSRQVVPPGAWAGLAG